MKFKCASGLEWDVSINLGIARKMAADEVIDLVNIAGFEELAQKLVNPIVALDVLWNVVEEQAKERGLDKFNFEKGITEEVLPVAYNAISRSAVSFIQALEQNTGNALEKGLGQIREMINQRSKALIDLMDSPKLQQKMKDEIEEMVVEIEAKLDENETDQKTSG